MKTTTITVFYRLSDDLPSVTRREEFYGDNTMAEARQFNRNANMMAFPGQSTIVLRTEKVEVEYP